MAQPDLAQSSSKTLKTLKTLAGSKALEQLLKDEHAEATFRDLEPVQQELVFAQMLKDHRQLKVVEKEHVEIQRVLSHVPSADRVVIFSCGKRLEGFKKKEEYGETRGVAPAHVEHEEGVDEGKSEESEILGLDERFIQRGRAFQDVWRYATEDDQANMEDRGTAWSLKREGKRVSWFSGGGTASHELWQATHDSPLKLYDFNWTADGRQRHYDFCYNNVTEEQMRNSYPRSFFQVISSHLLLYRLTVTLGPPPSDLMETQHIDEYKCCWGTLLVLQEAESDTILSHLTLYEHKGSASVGFTGTAEASEKAMALLSYLVGPDCAHTYDNVLAGNLA
jgi:hypothetical protein